MSISSFAIRRPITILMIFLGILLVGGTSLVSLPVELMPNASFRNVTIFISVRGGIPPPEIEKTITIPVEEAVGSVGQLRNIVSTSKKDRSIVLLQFEPGTDMNFAALEVREKFGRVRDKLPPEIEKPVIAKYEESDLPIMIVSLTSDKYTPEYIRTIVDEQLKERISRIKGVANVDVGGGRERKILVELDQARLQAYGLPIKRIISILSMNNLNLLTGEVERERDKLLVRTMGEFQDLEEIRDIIVSVTPTGSPIRLKNVGTVRDFYLEPESYARLNRKPSVSLYIQRETTANVVTVAGEVEKEIEGFKEILDEKINIGIVSNQAVFVEKSINTVRGSLIFGAFLASIVLLFFLKSLKYTLIVVLAIPISVMVTFCLMYISNMTLNVMTLCGLALGIGMLVDNSIVVLENIFRLREKQRGQDIDSKLSRETAIDGAKEVVLAIIASTVTTMIVFLPLIFINKQVRILYSGVALTVAFALLSSLFVSLTVVPLLASRIAETRRSVIGRVKRWYRHILVKFLRKRYQILILILAIFMLSVFVYDRHLDKEFLGLAEYDEFTIFVQLPSGAKIELSDEVVSEVETLIGSIPEVSMSVKDVTSRVEGWSSKLYVKLVPRRERAYSVQDIIEILRPQVSKIGKVYDAFIYFSEPESSKEIFLDVYGYDYDVLVKLATEMAKRIGGIPQLKDVKLRYRPGRPEMKLVVDKERAALYGLNVKDIAEIAHAKLRGLRATRYHTDGREIETIVREDDEGGRRLRDLGKLHLVAPNECNIYIDQIVNFERGEEPCEIWRKNKFRMIQVSGYREKISLGEVTKEIRAKLAEMSFPEDYFYRLGGDYEQMVQNDKESKFAIIVMVVLIFMVLASLFESYWQPFIIMITVPLAAIGAVISLFITKTPVSLGVFIGLIMLGGIVVNNAIILVDRINHIRREESSIVRTGAVRYFRAILQAGGDRLRPIMMTSLTTILGLLPMAMDKSEGSNLWAPLAITVIGGFLVSTFLTLFIAPSIYLIFEDIKGRIRKR